MESNKPYQPINCSLYDHLEIYAMQKIAIKIVYEQDGIMHVIHDRIKTIQSIDAVESLILNSGLSIRLDNLIKVGSIDFKTAIS